MDLILNKRRYRIVLLNLFCCCSVILWSLRNTVYSLWLNIFVTYVQVLKIEDRDTKNFQFVLKRQMFLTQLWEIKIGNLAAKLCIALLLSCSIRIPGYIIQVIFSYHVSFFRDVIAVRCHIIILSHLKPLNFWDSTLWCLSGFAKNSDLLDGL